MTAEVRWRPVLAGVCLTLGVQGLGLLPLFAWLMGTDDRREWLLSGPGFLAGMGGGPNRLWSLVLCVGGSTSLLVTGALLLRASRGRGV